MVVAEETIGSMLEIKPSTLKAWRKKRLIPYHKVGRLVRYDTDEIKRWLEKKKVEVISP